MNGSDAQAPLDLFCRAETVFAAILAGEGVAVLVSLAAGEAGDRLAHLGLSSMFILWVVLLAAGGLCLARRLLARLPPAGVAWAALLALQGMTLVVGGVVHGMFGGLVGEGPDFLLSVSGMAWVVGGMGLLAFHVHYRAHLLTLRVKASELAALHARIQPHFLFNTLNTAAALMHDRPDQAERVLEDLAGLFRAALEGPRRVLLADELGLVRRYLEIEGLRLEERLRVHWSLPEPLPVVWVPSLSIQPLVENAVRHGVEPACAGGEVEIGVSIQGGMLEVMVRNSLSLGPARTGHGMGLASVRERVDAMTGGRGRLEAGVRDGMYEARMVLPMGIES
ncbi:MAG: histidine kinase [Pseudomonadota bacterium]